RLGGRQPLCGTGVTSLIAVISNPADWSARIAASRPAPGPFTVTSTVFRPCSIAVLEAVSEAICAAKGVDFLDPLKPSAPADDQGNAVPNPSVLVMIVLLNVERMCAPPGSTFLFTFRLRVCCLRAIIIPPFPYLFFLIRNCFNWTFTGAGIVFGLLSTIRESTTVANTSVRCDFHQTFDVKVL